MNIIKREKTKAKFKVFWYILPMPIWIDKYISSCAMKQNKMSYDLLGVLVFYHFK